MVEGPSLGKKCSWFQPNGPAASRIDRIFYLINWWKNGGLELSG